MAFVKIPSKIIYGSKSFTDFYYGDGYLFRIADGNGNFTWIKTSGFIKFKFTEVNSQIADLEYSGQEYGGEPCFQGGGWKCYYCPSLGKWILTQNAPWWGYIPKTQVRTYYDPDNGYEYDYRGDLWWECASINTTPFDGAAVGTFTFGIDSSTAADYGLTQYANTTYVFTGDVANYEVARLVTGRGPCGTYDDGTYVGYPTWTYPFGSGTHYVVKYGDDKWHNIQYVNLGYIDDEYISPRWRGYVAGEFGMPNLDTNRGWYATQTEPTVGSDFALHFFHWVWNDPEDHDAGGSIVQESSWEDEDGNTHSKPDIVVTWDDIYDENTVPVGMAFLLTTIDMVEGAIWR